MCVNMDDMPPSEYAKILNDEAVFLLGKACTEM